ncbi:MAG: hypothetical protein R3Y24_02095 [Eubacteriales bacterium]
MKIKKNNTMNHTFYMIVLFILFAYRITFVNRIGDLGNGYFAIAFEFALLFYILFLLPLFGTVYKMMNARIQLKQYKLVHQIFNVSLLYVLIIGTFSVVCTYFLGGFFMETLFHAQYATLAFKYMGFVLLMLGVIHVLLAYFRAMGGSIQIKISCIVGILVVIITSYFSVGMLQEEGLKISALLQNEEFEYGFMAMGGTIALLVASVVIAIVLVLIYVINTDFRKKRMASDKSKTKLKILFILKEILINNAKATSISCFYTCITIVYLFLYQVLQQSNDRTHITQIGIFYGYAYIVVQFFVLLLFVVFQSESKNLKSELTEYAKRTININSAIKRIFIYSLFLGITLFIMGNTILVVLFQSSNIIVSNIMAIGSIIVIFSYLSYYLHMFLCYLQKKQHAIMATGICFALGIVITIGILLGTDYGIQSLFIGGCVFFVSSSIINLILVQKVTRRSVNYMSTFGIPILGGLAVIVVQIIFVKLLSNVIGDVFTLLIGILISLILYIIFLLRFKCIQKKDLRHTVGGMMIEKIAHSLHII